jgi:hypothetical protein
MHAMVAALVTEQPYRHPKVDLVGRPGPKQILCDPWRSRQKPRGDD